MSDRRRKRGQREGTIRKRGDGRWEGRIALGWQNGKRRLAYFYGRTRDDVQQLIIKALHDRSQGLPVVADKQTVAGFLAHWLEHTTKPTVRPRTYQSYELLARLHILPDLGNVPLVKLTPEHVEGLLARKLKAGLASQTVRHVRTVLRRALAQALKRGNVVRNVATMVDPPRLERRRQGHVLDAEQARTLLAAADGDRLMAPLLTLALTLGARRGELLGLRWSDLDVETGRVSIQQSVQRYTGTGLQATDPKTERSRRTLNLPQACTRVLRTWRAHQAQERLAAGPEWRDLGYIFTTPLGTPVDPRNLHRKFKSLIGAAGLPPATRFHDLRHACATYLLSQGIALRTISDLLGHSSISVTSDVYAHVAPELLEDAANMMDRLIK
jgi:integrase